MLGASILMPYGIHMASIWHPYGIHMASIWHPYGIHMASIWHPYGIHMASIWHPYGIHMASIPGATIFYRFIWFLMLSSVRILLEVENAGNKYPHKTHKLQICKTEKKVK